MKVTKIIKYVYLPIPRNIKNLIWTHNFLAEYGFKYSEVDHDDFNLGIFIKKDGKTIKIKHKHMRKIIDRRIQRIVHKFNAIKYVRGTCPDNLCTTCGGYWNRIYKSLTPRDKEHINNLMNIMSVKDLDNLGEYEAIIRRLNPQGYISIFSRDNKHIESENLNEILLGLHKMLHLSDNDDAYILFLGGINKIKELPFNQKNIRELDNVIHSLGKLLSQSNHYQTTRFLTELIRLPYDPLIEKGIQIAIQTRDYSLTETVILELRETALDYAELINVALEYSLSDEQMKRVLYNCFRNCRDDVRAFVGTGLRQHPWS